VLGRRVPALQSDGDIFFVVKVFAAGIILANPTPSTTTPSMHLAKPPLQPGGASICALHQDFKDVAQHPDCGEQYNHREEEVQIRSLMIFHSGLYQIIAPPIMAPML
jgi:hypothetical protein